MKILQVTFDWIGMETDECSAVPLEHKCSNTCVLLLISAVPLCLLAVKCLSKLWLG